MAIFLARTTARPDEILADGLADDVCALADDLLAIDTDLARSRLYHRLKPLQRSDEPLLVARLTDPPKAKRLPPGAATWLRDRLT
ncbi:MAG: hypothetical protein ACTHN0_07590 [Aquihabitans sp.]